MNLILLSAEIAAAVPELARDSVTNRAERIKGLIEAEQSRSSTETQIDGTPWKMSWDIIVCIIILEASAILGLFSDEIMFKILGLLGTQLVAATFALYCVGRHLRGCNQSKTP